MTSNLDYVTPPLGPQARPDHMLPIQIHTHDHKSTIYNLQKVNADLVPLSQRKTRCDPTLPRCLPCERSGSVCEYLDTTKGRKINRNYVILLQNKVRDLEAELGQYVDEDGDYPHSSEDIVRPGGMISLGGADAGDETPRYLGPSSGIAMTRLLMEEAKRYTESNRISDLIPELHARRQARMQSIQMTVPSLSRKRSYPMTSEHPAERLVERGIADKLVELFKQRGKIYTFPCSIVFIHVNRS